MTVSTITNLSNSLRRTYADKYFKAFQDDYTPLLDKMDECPDEPTRGEGWYFPFYMNTPQNWRTNSEAGAMGDVEQRLEVQGKVNAVEVIGWLQISEMLKNAGTKDAAWNGGELNRQMKETTGDITKGLQRMFSISHGTGRLAVVEAAVVAGNSFVAKNDEGTTNLMEGDRVDFVDLDTGGTVQLANRKITAIDHITRTVTFNGAPAALTANWGVYKTGDYGRGLNGLHGLVDDGTFQDIIHTQSRTTFPKLKSKVRGFAGTPTDLEEGHLREVCDDIYRAGGAIDSMQCNVGVLNAFFDIQGGNRRYNLEAGKTAKYNLGYREGDALFSYDKGTIVLEKNVNLPARSMYFFSLKQAFYKHTLKKLGWLDEGGSILRLTPNGSGFETSWTAIILTEVNFSCFAPIWNGVRRDIFDSSVAGDV